MLIFGVTLALGGIPVLVLEGTCLMLLYGPAIPINTSCLTKHITHELLGTCSCYTGRRMHDSSSSSSSTSSLRNDGFTNTWYTWHG